MQRQVARRLGYAVRRCGTGSQSLESPWSRPKLRLLPRHRPGRGGDARLARGVPWIFKDEAANVGELRALGRPAVLANVESDEGREVGVAVCNLQKGGEHGSVNILGRMVANNVALPVDSAFFEQHVRGALAHRERLFPEKPPFYRLLNAEGDHLPGVLCDRYGDVLCLQFTSAAMELLFEEEILDALEAVLAPRAIVMRFDAHTDRQLELAPVREPHVARGHYEGPTCFVDWDGLEWEVDLLSAAVASGRLFADRPTRELVAAELQSLPRKAKVLSLFGESSASEGLRQGSDVAFAMGLGEVGATHAQSLAARAREGGFLHLELAEPKPQLLPESLRATQQDLVTLEPPALAPTYGKQEDGLGQYAAWTALAASTVKPGGLFLIACRSRTVTAVKLLRSVNAGLLTAGRRARLVHRSLSGPVDFPVHIALPNTNEMQLLGLRML